MQAIRTSSRLITPLRQSNSVRQFANESKSSFNSGMKSERLYPEESSGRSDRWKIDEDLHGKLDQASKDAITAQLFPKQSSEEFQGFKSDRKKNQDPIKAGIDMFAEKVEKGGAKASEKMTVSKETADKAAHFATGAESVAKTGERYAESAAKSTGNAGEKIGDSVSAPKLSTLESWVGRRDADAEGPSASSPMMDKFADKMGDVGASIADKMKNLEGLVDSLPSMPKPVDGFNLRNTYERSKENLKDSMPSMEQAKETLKDSMPSMDSLKGMAYAAKDKVVGAAESLKDSMPSASQAADKAQGAAESLKDSMPSMESLKDSAKGAAYSAKGALEDKMPSMDALADKAKGAAYTAKAKLDDAMPSAEGTLKQGAEYIKEKASEAKDSAKAAFDGAASPSAYEQFRSGMASVKEAMKPMAQYGAEKLRDGASYAAEKIPPLASSLKDNIVAGATTVMNSKTVENLKDSLSSSAKGTWESAKDSASSMVFGKSDAAKMNIKEESSTVKKSDMKNLKDQEMSSSDIFKA